MVSVDGVAEGFRHHGINTSVGKPSVDDHDVLVLIRMEGTVTYHEAVSSP